MRITTSGGAQVELEPGDTLEVEPLAEEVSQGVRVQVFEAALVQVEAAVVRALTTLDRGI